jgi:predicted ester cyclase
MHLTPQSAMQAWFEDLWNKGDETTIDRMLPAHGIVHGLPTPDGQPIRGPEAFKPFYRSLRSAMPDISVEIMHSIAQGELTLAHCWVTGTHTGDGLQMPATNNRVEFWGFTLARFVDGQLVEGWNCFDFLGMYQQLGVQLNLPPAS